MRRKLTFPLVTSSHHSERSCWERRRPRLPVLTPSAWWLTRAGGDARAPSKRNYFSSLAPLKSYIAFSSSVIVRLDEG